jgi:hypothetical protein
MEVKGKRSPTPLPGYFLQSSGFRVILLSLLCIFLLLLILLYFKFWAGSQLWNSWSSCLSLPHVEITDICQLARLCFSISTIIYFSAFSFDSQEHVYFRSKKKKSWNSLLFHFMLLGRGCSSVVKCLPSMCKALGFHPQHQKKNVITGIL